MYHDRFAEFREEVRELLVTSGVSNMLTSCVQITGIRSQLTIFLAHMRQCCFVRLRRLYVNISLKRLVLLQFSSDFDQTWYI